MKRNNSLKSSVTGPLLKELVDLQKTTQKQGFSKSPVEKVSSPKQPDLYQDAGGGYNSDLTYPQE
jgi:hypothetical protein